MNNSIFKSELQIPEFESLGSKLNCEHCHYPCTYSKEMLDTKSHHLSKCDCKKFMSKFSRIKRILDILIFLAVTVFSLIILKDLIIAILSALITFSMYMLISYPLSCILIAFLCDNSEKRRRKKYDIKVQKLKQNNASIRLTIAGVKKETQEFSDNSKSLFNELNQTFKSITNNLNMEVKDKKRVCNKFQELLKELKILNSKLSENNFESTYITTLYEIHLPKLLEYSKQFLSYLNSGTLTQKQIDEFSKLLEVFSVKISEYTEYLQNKIEDDFIIKMKALNQDVMPDSDGSKVKIQE